LEGLCHPVLHLPSIPLEQDVVGVAVAVVVVEVEVEVVEDEAVAVVVQVLDVTEN
jgi:hypothetical protein